MLKILAVVFLSGIIMLTSGCSDNKMTNPRNQAPVITGLTVNPETAALGSVIEVQAQAFDPENEALTYHWSAASGYFIGTGEKVSFNSAYCCVAGLNEITLKVTDPQGYSAERKIWVYIEI